MLISFEEINMISEKAQLEKIEKEKKKLEEIQKENAQRIYKELSKHDINTWNIKSIKKAFAHLAEMGESEFKG
jgi:hypothetical protein